MHTLVSIVAVGAGGAVGAVARYGVAELIRVATSWPWYVATMLANVVGCFGIGIAFVRLEEGARPDWVKALLVTGLLGAFTTFSTFSLDAMHLIDDRRYAELAIYLTASVAAGLAAVKLGMTLA